MPQCINNASIMRETRMGVRSRSDSSTYESSLSRSSMSESSRSGSSRRESIRSESTMSDSSRSESSNMDAPPHRVYRRLAPDPRPNVPIGRWCLTRQDTSTFAYLTSSGLRVAAEPTRACTPTMCVHIATLTPTTINHTTLTPTTLTTTTPTPTTPTPTTLKHTI